MAKQIATSSVPARHCRHHIIPRRPLLYVLNRGSLVRAGALSSESKWADRAFHLPCEQVSHLAAHATVWGLGSVWVIAHYVPLASRHLLRGSDTGYFVDTPLTASNQLSMRWWDRVHASVEFSLCIWHAASDRSLVVLGGHAEYRACIGRVGSVFRKSLCEVLNVLRDSTSEKRPLGN